MRFLTALVCTLLISASSLCKESSSPATKQADLRIITLAPHLTEIVYALDLAEYLVAVSDYSDYPQAAQTLQRVASYQGVDFAAVTRLRPTHILAWRGGNKAQDIGRLRDMGFEVLFDAPESIHDLARHIRDIQSFIGLRSTEHKLAQQLESKLNQLKQQTPNKKYRAVYAMSDYPLSGMGNDPWINSILNTCGVKNIYADTSTSYMQLDISDILRSKPDLIISASMHSTRYEDSRWYEHKAVFMPHWIKVDPDSLHRFSPRTVTATEQLCANVADIIGGTP